MTSKEEVKQQLFLIFAGLTSISLCIIATSSVPLAKWAKSQNDCIEKTFRTDGTNNAGIPSKVWSCNGGGD